MTKNQVYGWLIAFAGVIGGLVASLAAFVEGARAVNSVAGLCALALVAGSFVTAALTWFALGSLRDLTVSRGTLALIAAGSAFLGAVAIAPFTLFAPLAASVPPRPVRANVQYWSLATGSRVAWVKIAALGKPRSTPVIILHGGPGYGEVECAPARHTLSDEFDVYYYDQVGAGLSARLANIAEYTVARHVRDLEEIRKQIGAEKVILIGGSWGGTLAAQYMAAYPDHVAKVVLSSPGAIEPSQWIGKEKGGDILSRLPPERRKALQRRVGKIRVAIAIQLSRRNPAAANAFLPDREIDTFFNAWMADAYDGALCSASASPNRNAAKCLDAGQWSNLMTVQDSETYSPLAPAKLNGNQTPTLVLSGECNYVPWAMTRQYAATLPKATLVIVPGAGHVISAEKPELYASLVRSFVMDQPLPLPAYTSDSPPEAKR